MTLREKSKVVQTRRYDNEVYRQRRLDNGKMFWSLEIVVRPDEVPDEIINHLKILNVEHKRRLRKA